MTDGTNRGMFNKITYTAPLVPALFSELTLGPNATVAKAYGPNSFVLEHLEVVDFVIKNADDNMHPLYALLPPFHAMKLIKALATSTDMSP